MEHEQDREIPTPGSAPLPDRTERPGPARPGLGRTLLTSGIAAAVFGAGGVGVGFLLAPDPGSAGQAPSTSVLGEGPASGASGADQAPSGGWHVQELPWTGGGTGDTRPGSGASGQGTRPATDDELTGLVRIHTTLNYGEGEAAGTGMVLTADGRVVTNHHVVEGATRILATDATTGRTYRAVVVGTDAKADVALLQLQDASGLSTVTTDSGVVDVGAAVTAVGDAGGSASRFTAAPGTVSATDQHITVRGDAPAGGESLSGLVRITSDVAPGDSGGATYDADGEVVGMTTAASSGGGEVDGYAIPISTVLAIVDDLGRHVEDPDYAYGRPAFLGVALDRDGTVERVYAGTAADRAGITVGARITRFDGARTATAAALGNAVRAHDPGDTAEVTWTGPDGQPHTASVTLGEGPVR